MWRRHTQFCMNVKLNCECEFAENWIKFLCVVCTFGWIELKSEKKNIKSFVHSFFCPFHICMSNRKKYVWWGKFWGKMQLRGKSNEKQGDQKKYLRLACTEKSNSNWKKWVRTKKNIPCTYEFVLRVAKEKLKRFEYVKRIYRMCLHKIDAVQRQNERELVCACWLYLCVR